MKFPNGETQLNCFGVEYAGFPRKIEAVFNSDGKLYFLWILTAKQEENRVRKSLIEMYGVPIYKDDKLEVYNKWKVSLRKDKPEILVLSIEGAKMHKKGIMNNLNIFD